MTDRPTDADAHDRAVAADLALLGLPAGNWPAAHRGPDGAPMHDVVIVGAGMCGLAAAAALSFKGVRNVLVLDRAAEGREGPWLSTARMTTLRSPKHLPGIALGIPSLTFRAWFTARRGAAAWEALYKIANADWAAYLLWLRRVLGLPVRNGTEVAAVEPAGAHLRLRLAGGATLHARRVVLATGRPGAGGLALPAGIDPALWPDRAAHAGEEIDFAPLAGRRVAVLGGGPAAWDNAAVALEAGAAGVDIYIRRAKLPQINKGRGSAGPAFFEGWPALPPGQRWQLLAYMHDQQSPPPHESIHRVLAHANARVHLGAPLLAATRDGAGVRLTLGPDGRAARVDFLIVATGFAVDLARQPELAAFAPHIATWADAFTPPPGLERPELGRFPFLGPGFELTERRAGACPALGRVHLFNHAATASMGAIASDIPGVSTAAERLARHIVQSLFREDFASVMAGLEAFAEPELESTPFFDPAAFPKKVM